MMQSQRAPPNAVRVVKRYGESATDVWGDACDADQIERRDAAVRGPCDSFCYGQGRLSQGAFDVLVRPGKYDGFGFLGSLRPTPACMPAQDCMNKGNSCVGPCKKVKR